MSYNTMLAKSNFRFFTQYSEEELQKIFKKYDIHLDHSNLGMYKSLMRNAFLKNGFEQAYSKQPLQDYSQVYLNLKRDEKKLLKLEDIDVTFDRKGIKMGIGGSLYMKLENKAFQTQDQKEFTKFVDKVVDVLTDKIRPRKGSGLMSWFRTARSLPPSVLCN